MELRHEGRQYARVFRKLMREERLEGEKKYIRRATARIVQKKK